MRSACRAFRLIQALNVDFAVEPGPEVRLLVVVPPHRPGLEDGLLPGGHHNTVAPPAGGGLDDHPPREPDPKRDERPDRQVVVREASVDRVVDEDVQRAGDDPAIGGLCDRCRDAEVRGLDPPTVDLCEQMGGDDALRVQVHKLGTERGSAHHRRRGCRGRHHACSTDGNSNGERAARTAQQHECLLRTSDGAAAGQFLPTPTLTPSPGKGDGFPAGNGSIGAAGSNQRPLACDAHLAAAGCCLTPPARQPRAKAECRRDSNTDLAGSVSFH